MSEETKQIDSKATVNEGYEVLLSELRRRLYEYTPENPVRFMISYLEANAVSLLEKHQQFALISNRENSRKSEKINNDSNDDVNGNDDDGSENEVGLDTLPTEILYQILKQLPLSTLCRLGLVCKRFYQLFNSNEVWRMVFHEEKFSKLQNNNRRNQHQQNQQNQQNQQQQMLSYAIGNMASWKLMYLAERYHINQIFYKVQNCMIEAVILEKGNSILSLLQSQPTDLSSRALSDLRGIGYAYVKVKRLLYASNECYTNLCHSNPLHLLLPINVSFDNVLSTVPIGAKRLLGIHPIVNISGDSATALLSVLKTLQPTYQEDTEGSPYCNFNIPAIYSQYEIDQPIASVVLASNFSYWRMKGYLKYVSFTARYVDCFVRIVRDTLTQFGLSRHHHHHNNNNGDRDSSHLICRLCNSEIEDDIYYRNRSPSSSYDDDDDDDEYYYDEDDYFHDYPKKKIKEGDDDDDNKQRPLKKEDVICFACKSSYLPFTFIYSELISTNHKTTNNNTSTSTSTSTLSSSAVEIKEGGDEITKYDEEVEMSSNIPEVAMTRITEEIVKEIKRHLEQIFTLIEIEFTNKTTKIIDNVVIHVYKYKVAFSLSEDKTITSGHSSILALYLFQDGQLLSYVLLGDIRKALIDPNSPHYHSPSYSDEVDTGMVVDDLFDMSFQYVSKADITYKTASTYSDGCSTLIVEFVINNKSVRFEGVLYSSERMFIPFSYSNRFIYTSHKFYEYQITPYRIEDI